MFCEKYADPGILYLYDELEPDAKHEFEAHLRDCQLCQAELSLLKKGKQFAQILPLEEIAPISFADIALSVKPGQNIFEKYIQPLWRSIRSFFQNKRRLVLVPMGVSLLLLMMFYIIDRGFKPSVSPYSETAFDWDVGLSESLNSLDQKIAQLKSENMVLKKNLLDSTLYYTVDYFSDHRVDQIAADIQALSSELSQFNF